MDLAIVLDASLRAVTALNVIWCICNDERCSTAISDYVWENTVELVKAVESDVDMMKRCEINGKWGEEHNGFRDI